MGSVLGIRSQRIWLGSELVPGIVWLTGETIGRIGSYSDFRADLEIEITDVGDAIVMPGGIDVHVHMNEPGRTHWEGFESATRAAAAGGITTLGDMPLNCDPVITTVEAWEGKLAAASADKLWVNCAFYAGVVPGHIDDLDDLLARGAAAGKAFMIESGIGDFPAADRETLHQGMRVLARYDRPLLVHAEVDIGSRWPAGGNTRSYIAYLRSRPPEMELAAIRQLIDLCRQTGCATHIVHLSAAEALPLIAAAKDEGLPLTVETAPHYLFFTAETIPAGATAFKCAPPIRPAANQKRLLEALFTGQIDLVATDHSPAEPALKKLDSGDFKSAWGGISSLQWLLPLTWTIIEQHGPGLSFKEKLSLFTRLIHGGPAALLGLSDGGGIAPGRPANLIAWDPDLDTEIQLETTFHKHKISPYLGQILTGRVTHTWVNGRPVVYNGSGTNFLWGGPNGRLQM